MPLVNPAFRASGSINPSRFVAPASTSDFSVMSAGVALVCNTNTSTSVTSVPANTIPNGAMVSGSGVPAGAYVVSGGGTSTLTLSAATTTSLTGTTLTFIGKPIGIAQDGSKFPQTADGWGSGASTVAAEDGDQLTIFGLGEVCLLEVDNSGAPAAPAIAAGDWLVSDANGKGVKFNTNGTGGLGDNIPVHVGAIALEAPGSSTNSNLIRVQVVNFTFTQ